MLFGIPCLHLHHTVPHSGAVFIFNYFVLFSSYLPSTIMPGSGEVTEISKCWCAAYIVSDYNDNSAKIGNSA